MPQYKIFDFHAHAFPDDLAPRSMEYLSDKSTIPYFYDGTIGGLREATRAGGGTAFLLAPIATNPSQTRNVNTWAAARQKEGDGCYAFGSVHPLSETIREDLDLAVSLGLRGIKLHPEYQDFYADDERMFPIYEEIFRRDLPVLFHAGVDLGFDPPIHGSPDRIAKVCDAFPEAKIIAAHMGGYQQYDLAERHLYGRDNLWIDTSFAAERMEPAELLRLIRKCGVNRVMFGTDGPWCDFTESVNSILNCGLTEDELKAVLWDNAEQLINELPRGRDREVSAL